MDNIAISVRNVSKTFILPHEKHTSIKSVFINFYRRSSGYEKQQVLDNISFEIKRGEFFGIVGRNGSGKSTLLKLISQIYTPDSGAIVVNGKLTPFIELGVGFNPELSGRENVFLNGALLGFTRKEMMAMYDEIVEFAELERFMDQKLKNYSSGMQVRLAFSIAIRANTDILVLDEVLAVGDAAFQAKCYDYFEELKSKGKTVILVTHDMGSVERFCTQALLLENGHIKSIGKPANVARQYTIDNFTAEAQHKSNTSKKSKRISDQVELLDIRLLSGLSVSQEANLELEITYELNEPLEVDLGISIISQNHSILEHNTKNLKLNYKTGVKHKLRYIYPLELLNPGRYEVSVAIFEKQDFKLIGFDSDSCSFMIEGDGRGGILSRRGKWKVIDG